MNSFIQNIRSVSNINEIPDNVSNQILSDSTKIKNIYYSIDLSLDTNIHNIKLYNNLAKYIDEILIIMKFEIHGVMFINRSDSVSVFNNIFNYEYINLTDQMSDNFKKIIKKFNKKYIFKLALVLLNKYINVKEELIQNKENLLFNNSTEYINYHVLTQLLHDYVLLLDVYINSFNIDSIEFRVYGYLFLIIQIFEYYVTLKQTL